MRFLILTSWLLFLAHSPAEAVTRSLDLTGEGTSSISTVTFFGPASDYVFEFNLDLSLEGPCGASIGPLTGHLVISGHEDGWEGPIDPALGSILRDGELDVVDPETGNVVLTATMTDGMVVWYTESSGDYSFEAIYATTSRREITSDCQWGELLSSDRQFRLRASLASAANEEGGYTNTLDGRMKDALLTAVPNETYSWGTLKAAY